MDIQEVIDELTAFYTVVDGCECDNTESCEECQVFKACMEFGNEHLAKVLDSALDILRDVKKEKA